MCPSLSILTCSLGPSQTSSASAAILMALMSVKCTPKQNVALVDLKDKIGLLIYILLLTAHFFFPFTVYNFSAELFYYILLHQPLYIKCGKCLPS